MPLTIDELKKLPYLDLSALDGHTVQVMPLWDGTSWQIWVDTEVDLMEGKSLMRLRVTICQAAAKQTDIFINSGQLTAENERLRASPTMCTIAVPSSLP